PLRGGGRPGTPFGVTTSIASRCAVIGPCLCRRTARISATWPRRSSRPSAGLCASSFSCHASTMAELPGGTVTFLFSDIEGSTRLVKQLRERWSEVLADHQRLLRASFASHGGHEVDTQGGSF